MTELVDAPVRTSPALTDIMPLRQQASGAAGLYQVNLQAIKDLVLAGSGTSALSLIQAITADGSVGTYTFSSIPQTYRDLLLVVTCRTDNAAQQDLRLQINGNSGAVYNRERAYWQSATGAADQALSATSYNINQVPGSGHAAGMVGTLEAEFLDYKSTTFHKSLFARARQPNSTTTQNHFFMTGSGLIADLNAITSLTVALALGNFVSGSKIALYGRG
jgi:hypothetical protein